MRGGCCNYPYFVAEESHVERTQAAWTPNYGTTVALHRSSYTGLTQFSLDRGTGVGLLDPMAALWSWIL